MSRPWASCGRSVRAPNSEPGSARRRSSGRGQVDEAGWCRAEAAGREVKRRQILLEIDVNPLAARCPGLADGLGDDLSRDALPLAGGCYLRVDQERVVAAVPGHVDESDQRSVRPPRGDPAQAVRPDLIPPARLTGAAV